MNILKDVSDVTEVSFSYLKTLHKNLNGLRQESPKQIKDVLTYIRHINNVHGPHAVTVLELAKDTLVIIFGEIHQNPEGCNGNGFIAMHRLVIDMMMHIPNLFLILESFFHLWIKNVEHAKQILKVLKQRQGSVHSMWNALACLSSSNEQCSVDDKQVGELILLRSFALLIQVIAAHLHAEKIKDSVFYDLEARIKFMDCREDLLLVPWEWLKGKEDDKLKEVKTMLKHALLELDNYIPNIRCNDLRNMYLNNVNHPLIEKIKNCIDQPTRSLYEEIFTEITELVTIATLFHCLETYYDESGERAQFVIVVGDKHREYIVNLLMLCLGTKVVKRHEIVGHQPSCVNIKHNVS